MIVVGVVGMGGGRGVIIGEVFLWGWKGVDGVLRLRWGVLR